MDRDEKRQAVRVIGVTGGVGAGKSRILSLLQEEYQAQVIYADQVAAKLEEPGGQVLQKLAEVFGTGILEEGGRLNREAFAHLIFHDAQALAASDAIIHPQTWREIRKMIRESSHPLIVVEAALFDEKSRETCDTLWYIDTSRENRIARLMAIRGYDREKCQAIMENQPGRDFFLALADVVIDNNGTLKQTRRQIAELLGESGKNR